MSIMRNHGIHRATRSTSLIAAALFVAAGCGDVFQVENPNNVLQEDLERPASGTALVNGAHARVAIAFSTMLRTLTPASDEAFWTGSFNSVRELGAGNHGDHTNEEIDATFNNMSVGRWMADEAVRTLEAFQAAGTLRVPADLPRAYNIAGIAYTMIPDAWDDFVIGSDRTIASAPVGAANMGQLYDEAITRFDKAITAAQALPAAQAAQRDALHTNALALRARAKYQKSLRSRIRPAVQPNALVNDAGAVADATAALARMTGDWKFAFSFDGATTTSNFNVYLNNRLEYTIGEPYARRRADGKRAETVIMNDPITGAPAPALIAAINAAQGSGNYGSSTVVSARELLLILAEADLAAGNTAGFTTHINRLRALDGLTPYAGQIPAFDLLKHSRRVNLFLQGKRIMDQYRFGERSAEWIDGSLAVRTPGTLMPIGQTERLSNCHLLGGC
jgi:starch-binding outer membrane protein, SusD/RagB family